MWPCAHPGADALYEVCDNHGVIGYLWQHLDTWCAADLPFGTGVRSGSIQTAVEALIKSLRQ